MHWPSPSAGPTAPVGPARSDRRADPFPIAATPAIFLRTALGWVNFQPANGSVSERRVHHGMMNGGIQHQAGHWSAGPAIIAAALAPDPGRRIVIPFVTGVGQRAERGFDFVPALVVL